MRALETLESKERKARKMQIIVGIFLAVIMIGSTAGFAYYLREDTSSTAEGDYFDGKYWIMQRNGQTFYLYSSLDEIANVSSSLSPGDFIGQPFFIDAPLAVSQHILLNLPGYFSRLQPACYGACEADLPEKDCSEPIIVYRDATENRVYKQNSCIFIEGDSRSIDAFITSLAGVSE